MHNLRLLLSRLADAGIGFVVVGGYAGVFHGSALLAFAPDICVERDVQSLSALHEAATGPMPDNVLSRYEAWEGEPPFDSILPADLMIKTDLGIVHVHSFISGVGDYAHLRQHAEEFTVFGRRCTVISLADLISAREAVGREKDLLAVKELRAIAAKRAQG